MDKTKCTKFANCVNDLQDYVSILSIANTDDDIHSLEASRVELNSFYDQVKKAYVECRDYEPGEGQKPIDKNKLRTHYLEAIDVYKKAIAAVNGQIQTLKQKESEEKIKRETLLAQKQNDSTAISRLPACDTDVFKGGYNAWPSFRDLFTAIYIRGSKLSNVEKYFHLTQKTSGEARELISHVPLTNDGFELAWKILTDRYENKRMQVNEQLKILFNLPNVTSDSSHSIQKLQRTVNSCIQTLETLKVEVSGWDPILTYICSSKLPRTFLEEFENTLEDCKTLPTWNDFNNFLTHKFKTLESVGNIRPNFSKQNQQTPYRQDNSKKMKFTSSFQTNINQKAQSSKGTLNANASQQPKTQYQNSCQICKANHFIRDCPQFLAKNVNDRIHVVKISHLCYNCLSTNHGVKECKSRFGCRTCNLKHHTLLHKGKETLSAIQTTVQEEARPSTSAAALTTLIQSTTNQEAENITTLTLQDGGNRDQHPGDTLLFTAVVQIEANGHYYDARAIIDSGSQSTFITEKLKNRLNLPTKRNLVHVTGINQLISETSAKACVFKLRSKLDPNFKLEVWAPVLKSLPSNLPPYTLEKTQMRDATNLELADPKFYVSQPVDLLIGMDIGPLIFTIGTPMKSIGSLLAQKTVFGWIIGGPLQDETQKRRQISLCNTVSIEKILTRFWEVEETPKQVLRSDEDVFCEQNFVDTTKRNTEGRYIVTLPFKKCEELGDSRNIALAQFYRMERKLMKTPEIKELYDNTIMEYLELGHMRKISSNDISKTPNYYLPHHAVIRPEKITSKLRVVFNASSPTSNKRSLNDNLYAGPVLQQDIVLQVLKWRFFRHVYNADVTKMYRQILLDPTQTKFQRILFRKSPSDPVEDYELQTVTFGVNCAPFLALRTLIQLAEDTKDTYPIASKVILENLYVDDVLAGGHSLEDTVKSRKELTAAMESAGFELMKWTANDPKLISDLPKEKLNPVNSLDISDDASTKTLGIKWNISGDFFSFTPPTMEIKTSYTKREVLSIIAKLFDPCGWLAPIVIVAKLVMQQIWLDKINWDDILKTITLMNWQNFVKNSGDIGNLKIPRWIHFTPDSDVEIHGFCDASESAYAAALYIRVRNTSNEIQTSLLTAKTRVAPIKKISLPRLELCGAVLLSKLSSSILNNLQISKFNVHYWTDSTIVLAWLKKPPCHWSTFVGNRVSEIIENVGIENWAHVDSKDNPADIASRGCSPSELNSHQLWWNGPDWLKLPKDSWPSKEVSDVTLEAKTSKVLMLNTDEMIEKDPMRHISSLTRVYRAYAQALRFWKNTLVCRQNPLTSEVDLTADEIQAGKRASIIRTQRFFFPEEIQALEKKSRIPSKSPLLSLNPYLDPKGIMRAHGRLVQSPALTFEERHPIILPHNAKLTTLLVEHTHKVTLHGGNQLMLRVLRSGFCIPRLKSLIKKTIRNCRVCILHKKRTENQIMASLPPERTLLTRPFTNTGVDFAGPFSIRNFTGRACLITKGYVCLFVCFATKAIHLEPTSDLSTQSFLAAFSRFISRRGCPSCVYSDNGTNFVGAVDVLKKDRLLFMKELKTKAITQNSHQNLDWKFIPPGAPHMGGLWEAGVKSFKTHLKKCVPKMTFTFEEFSTILSKIEACLNSRPLSPASDDPSDLSPLTPAHFLIGTPILAPPEPDVSDQDESLVNRWKRLKIISQYFCNRWKTEYLQELHRRTKWKYQRDNIKEGDLVVIKDERLTPTEWKLGRIIKTHQGTDQNVRVVDIKTAGGDISRPITKMAAYLPNDWQVEASPSRPERRESRRLVNERSPEQRPSRHQSTNRPARAAERRPSPERRQRSRSDNRNLPRVRPSHWQYACGLCQQDHALSGCQRFREKTPYQRYETVERRGYCRNCLARSHLAPDCPCITGCKRCDYRHHTLLHGAPQLNDSLQPAVAVVEPVFTWDLVFLPTAMIRLKTDEMDTYYNMRALVSQSAVMTRIAYSTFQRVGLRSFTYQGRRFTTFKIMARRTNSTWALKVNALVTDELPRRLYSDPLIENPTSYFTDEAIADPDPRSNIPIDLELGADTYSAIIKEGSTAAGVGDVKAFNTNLGYVFAGPIRNMPVN
ncbi:uncharacterized protein isoform X1 [Musca autumnalis]|uniref:uncharacterized protein isoform X1 n=2 Tax=Musca autumnalis TaxID=221902 RepID=UPI003CE7125D